jgi:hypothetical protein
MTGLELVLLLQQFLGGAAVTLGIISLASPVPASREPQWFWRYLSTPKRAFAIVCFGLLLFAYVYFRQQSNMSRIRMVDVLLPIYVGMAFYYLGYRRIHNKVLLEEENAQCGLESYREGLRYLRGDGVLADYNAANKYLSDAASEGYAKALFHLGVIDRDGLGVKANKITAHAWFNLASARSDGSDRKEALKARKEIELQLDAREITEAQRLAREWDEAHPR